jgi:hypothetical protein
MHLQILGQICLRQKGFDHAYLGALMSASGSSKRCMLCFGANARQSGDFSVEQLSKV